VNKKYLNFLSSELGKLKEQGLYKTERIMTSPQGARVQVNGQKVLNFCANNYLGLANHPDLVRAAQDGLAQRGFGMSSVRFICGTQDIHKELEAQLSAFLGMADTQLYGSCFDANGGVFEALLGEEDAIISDALNHASLIDGIRLCKAQRYRYANSDMAELELRLKEAGAAGARFKLVVTDGVFSMDGYLANLPGICDLAERYGAMVMVDDSHAVGFIGEHGRGTHEHHGVMGRVDILTGTLGKALGGASGGYIASSQPVVDMLRQKSRPYLFSNTLAPSIVATSLKVLAMLREGDGLRRQLRANALQFRTGLEQLGFKLLQGEHPIIPVMFYEAPLAQAFAAALLEEGVYVTGFFFPVVPKGQARIRTQMSAAHSTADIAEAIQAFAKVGRALGVIK
jgi:glycine C-acetyltransferase